MIGFFFTVATMLCSFLLGVSHYISFLLLVFILLFYRKSIGMKSTILGYVFLFQKKKTNSTLLNRLSALLFILFYFREDLVPVSLEIVFSIFILYFVLYYWLFEGLP